MTFKPVYRSTRPRRKHNDDPTPLSDIQIGEEDAALLRSFLRDRWSHDNLRLADAFKEEDFALAFAYAGAADQVRNLVKSIVLEVERTSGPNITVQIAQMDRQLGLTLTDALRKLAKDHEVPSDHRLRAFERIEARR